MSSPSKKKAILKHKTINKCSYKTAIEYVNKNQNQFPNYESPKEELSTAIHLVKEKQKLQKIYLSNNENKEINQKNPSNYKNTQQINTQKNYTINNNPIEIHIPANTITQNTQNDSKLIVQNIQYNTTPKPNINTILTPNLQIPLNEAINTNLPNTENDSFHMEFN